MSQRRLAALMELNHAAVSLALQGERKLTLDEAATLARLLGEPFEEIVRRMGIAVPAPRGAVLLNHTIDRTGRIIKQQPSGPRTIPAPPGCSANLQAARFACADIARLDKLVVFWEPLDRVVEDVSERLCVVEPVGSNDRLARFVRRGATPGTYDLESLARTAAETDVRLATASPVVWTKP